MRLKKNFTKRLTAAFTLSSVLAISTATLASAETYPDSHEIGQTNSSGGINVAIPPKAPNVQQITQFAGADRYETSAKVAFAASEGTKSAVLVNGENSAPDAFSGGAYATAQGSALLLTQRDSLPKVISDRLVELKVTSVTILGSQAAVSDNVVNQLKTLGINSVSRIAGVDRYETSLLVSEQPIFDSSKYAFVANGENGVDAVSGGGVAGAFTSPVVLVPANDATRVKTDKRYDSIRAKNTVVVLGNQRAINDDTYDAISGDERLGGTDRYITSIVVAQWARKQGLPVAGVSITTADNNVFIDALSAASFGNPTLLTPSDKWTEEIYYFINDYKVSYLLLEGKQTPLK